MNVIYDIASIRISEVHTQQVRVPRWEIPVLQVLHGNDLQVTGQTIVKRAIPDPSAEFQRLADRYGPRNEDLPAVAAVYGNFGPGTQALRREIRDSLTSAGATPSDYKSPAERKLEAEKNAVVDGQTITEEAKAQEDAAAAVALDSAAKTAAPVIEGNGAKGKGVKGKGAKQEAIGPDSVVAAPAASGVDADIASLI